MTILDKDAFRAIVLAAVAAPRANFVFSGDPVPFSGPSGLDKDGTPFAFPYVGKNVGGGLQITATVSGLQSDGVDEVRLRLNTTTNLQESTQCGNRRFTVSLRFESDQSGEAYELADRVRTRIRRAGARAAMEAAGLALVTSSAVQDVVVTWDKREISAAVLDLFLAAAVKEADPTSDGVWIETADITGSTTL